MEKLKWHNERRKVNDLISFKDNPRKITEKQKADLKVSLERFNLVEIPAIDTDNIIIAGHQRLKIMQLLGRGEEIIDVRMPNRKLTLEEFREYNMRSNKNTAGWDYNILKDIDYNILKDIGWDKEELDEIFNEEVEEDEFNAEQEYEKIKEPTVKLGELYQLGEHRLLCGDATKKEDVEKLMGGGKSKVMFYKPPV